MHDCAYLPGAAGLRPNKAMELPGRGWWRAGPAADGRRNRLVDTAASGGRDCRACGGRRLIAEPLRRTSPSGGWRWNEA